jgi:hypothetical protein
MPPAVAAFLPVPRRLAAVALAGLWLGMALAAPGQPPAPAATASASAAPMGKASAKAPGASMAKVAAKPAITRPLWSELTEAQRQALAPLAGKWDTVSEAQKRKWLALSQNYPRLSQPEQAKLHSRMTEWVGLSPQQRTQARLNYGKTQQIPADDKKAKWEAYQALSPEEKRKLAAGAAKSPATAAAIKPVPREKLAKVPSTHPSARPPRIAAGANQVDPNTLLPQPAGQAQ